MRSIRLWSTRHAGSRVRLGAAGTALALQLGSAPPSAAATTYYVDNTNPACSNAGTGSAAAPYCSIVSAAAAHHGPDITIRVAAGTYREQVAVSYSGAAGMPFVFEAASPGVTVDGSDDFGGTAQWVQVSGNVWRASAVTWAPNQVFGDGTRLAASTLAPVSMPARTFQFVAGIGLYVNAGGGNPGGHATQVGHRMDGFAISGKSWVSIRGFRTTHCEDKGIVVQSASSNVEVADNASNLNFKFGIQVAGSTVCTVARNAVSENGGHGIALTAGSAGCTIENNECWLNADPNVRIANGLYLFGAPNNLIRGNRYHDNQDTGQHIQSASNGCVSIQNRSWRNGDHGFDHLGSTGTLHLGDVAWGNYRDGFSIEGNAGGTRLYNCIAVENGLTTNEFDLWVDQGSSAGFVSDYNIFWNSTVQPPVKYIATLYPSVAEYGAVSGQDARTLQLDPQFARPDSGDFHLEPGSPAIDNANSGIAGWPANDANGLPRLDDPVTPNAGTGLVDYADRGALEFPPVVLALTSTSGTAPLALFADATGSVGPDGTVASYRFDFGDGTVVGPQAGATALHTYAAGIWTITLTVTDRSGGSSTATAVVTVVSPHVDIVETRIGLGSDDAEEQVSNRNSQINGNRLELMLDRTVGVRFPGLAIPPRAIIAAAWIQFVAREANSQATNLTFQAEAADNAATFTNALGNVSSRPRTTASTSWSPGTWVQNQAGAAQRTPDLKALIQEVVDRPGWASGNAISIIANGGGRRIAFAYEGSRTLCPLLHIEFADDLAPTVRLALRPVAGQPLAVVADAGGSSDPDPSPIASYRFDFGDSTAQVTTNAPFATAHHVYADVGTYTVTVVATDTRGNASNAASAGVTVDIPPTAQIALSQRDRRQSPPPRGQPIPSSPNLAVGADASASSDPDDTPIASYRFDFGDNSGPVTTQAPVAQAQHTYAATGTYTVTVVATDTRGNASDPASATITIQAPPTARLAVSQLASPDHTVSADGSASTDVDATPIASYRFDFGDSTPVVVTTAPTSVAPHTYAAGGAHTVTLIAIDSRGFASAPATARINVDAPPVARLAVTQLGSPALTVNADAAASTDDVGIAGYRFDFGDGSAPVLTTAPTADAHHTYAVADTYVVTVVATANGGFVSAPATARIIVNGAPVARLAVAQARSLDFTISADASASTDPDPMPIASYRFDFGDSTPVVVTTAPAAVAQHTYGVAGTYTVTVTVTDAGGLTSQASTRVGLDVPPVARLAVTTLASPLLSVNADASASTDDIGITSYTFDFGDSSAPVLTTPPTASAQHTYAGPGVYDVSVIAADTRGAPSTPAVTSVRVVAIVETRIGLGSDDAEEQVSNRNSQINGNRLELMLDRTVGVRFPSLAIPPRAIIAAAWIQFVAREANSEATNLTFQAEAADNAATFTNALGNVTSRPRTTASASWSPGTWVQNQAGAAQRTPDLKALIQEVVDRPGWASGNAISIIANGGGRRIAFAYEGSRTLCPLLHIEYTLQGLAPVARLQVAPAGQERATFADRLDALPRELVLSAPRPNPVTGAVSFRLELPRATRVHWGIYDVQGRAVWSEERVLEPGRADLSWNGAMSGGSRAGSGMYFARVRAENKVLVRRFIRL